VARVGGLADTVIDANEMALAAKCATGVQFAPVDADTLEVALRHTAELYSNRKVWARMQRNGMATDVSWRRPAHHYAALYRDLLAARAMDRTV
jgi:starch synthase